eukprot:TRINITY_DN2050_c0_g1_i5.p1 TRINITY_DN2050_c0_g1~~TRINITY_DN2050_c0_g1_i5.p1  ORF type:complete len:197 (-),score=20.92 TRINITY_DN2050_c0_g1_i5:37-627(-)
MFRIVAVFLLAFVCVSAHKAGSCEQNLKSFISEGYTNLYNISYIEKPIRPFILARVASTQLKQAFNSCQDILKVVMSTRASSDLGLQCFNNWKAATLSLDSFVVKTVGLANGKIGDQEYKVAQQALTRVIAAAAVSCGEAFISFVSQSDDSNCQGLINNTKQYLSEARQSFYRFGEFFSTSVGVLDYCLPSIPKRK